MKIGFALPQYHKQALGIARTAEFAHKVEEAGAASLWVSDRNLAIPVWPHLSDGQVEHIADAVLDFFEGRPA